MEPRVRVSDGLPLSRAGGLAPLEVCVWQTRSAARLCGRLSLENWAAPGREGRRGAQASELAERLGPTCLSCAVWGPGALFWLMHFLSVVLLFPSDFLSFS